MRYPAIVDLLALVSRHALPTFEIGNSLFVSLPTVAANGSPLFGGEGSLRARKSSLEAAGISVPSSVDLAHGFTMTRGWKDSAMTFHTLFTAFGRTDEPAPVRLLANAIGRADHTRSFTIGHAGATSVASADHQGTATTVSYTSTTEDGSVRTTGSTTTDDTGATSSSSTTHTLVNPGATPLWARDDVESETSADGARSVTTTTRTYIQVDAEGSSTSSPFSTTVTVCDNGTCESFTEEEPSADGDYVPTTDDGTSVAYIDPQAAEAGGLVGAVTPGAMNVAVTLSKTTLVVQDWNDPLSSYTVPPTGIHDIYGPIALYGGEVDGAGTSITGFGTVPTFVRLPQPEIDPHHADDQPSKDAPPDRQCLYCGQP